MTNKKKPIVKHKNDKIYNKCCVKDIDFVSDIITGTCITMVMVIILMMLMMTITMAVPDNMAYTIVQCFPMI